MFLLRWLANITRMPQTQFSKFHYVSIQMANVDEYALKYIISKFHYVSIKMLNHVTVLSVASASKFHYVSIKIRGK